MTWPESVPKPEAVEAFTELLYGWKTTEWVDESDAMECADLLADKANAALTECAEVIERLKLCGACGEARDVDGCFMGECWQDMHQATSEDDDATGVAAEDPCHFTPSRWTPYWDAEQKEADHE